LPVAVLLTWLGPFSMDAYSPAFPAIQKDFATSAGAVQATLATTLVGLALGQLLVGPISDRYGRRRPLLVGLSGYVVASVLCASAWTIELLIAARFVQGFAAATGIAIARAIARDVHSGTQLARFYSLLTAATAIAPMVAPIAGAGLLESGLSWRWIFGVTLILGVIGLAAVVLLLPETHPRWIGGHTPAGVGHREPEPTGHLSLWVLLRRREVFVSALVLGLCGAAMIAHLAGLSFFLQDERGLSPAAYGAVFALDAAGLVIANNVNRLVLRRWSSSQVLSVSVPVMLAFALAFAAMLRAEAPLPAVLPALFLFISCWGFVMPNSIAVGMSVERAAAGRASAILGVAQFGFAAFSAPLVGTIPVLAGTPPMGTVIVVCLAGAVMVQVGARFVGRRAAAAPADAAPTRNAAPTQVHTARRRLRGRAGRQQPAGLMPGRACVSPAAQLLDGPVCGKGGKDLTS
jgi:DHA1 family bicyclomycin/chloramphenicol resistance-like MFS transporter